MKITTKQIRDASKKTGYTIVSHITINNTDKCGCPLAILHMAETNNMNPNYSDIFNWADDKYNSYFISGLVCGFDNETRAIDAGLNREYDGGFYNGRILRKYLL